MKYCLLLTLKAAAVPLLEMTNRFLPWQPCSRLRGSLVLELETCIPVGMDWNKPGQTCYLTAELLGALVAQDGNLYTRLWNGICPFLTFFFFLYK